MDQLKKFQIYIEPEAQRLLFSAIRLTGTLVDAEDLTQETLFKAYKNIDRFKEGTNARAWAFTIMKNTFLNEIRYQKKRKATLLEQSVVENIKDDSIAEYGSSEIDDSIQSLIDALPEDMRVVLVMREIQGLEYKQIAKSLNLPLGTVKSRLKRAREKLKEDWFSISES